MSSVCIFPPIDNISQLRDLASRIAWHFEHVNDAQFVLPVTGNHVDLSKLAVPEGFDDNISRALPGLLERMQLIRVNEPTEALPLLDDSEVILKRVQDIPWVEQ